MASDTTSDISDRVPVQLRVPPELRRRAKADAGRHDRSMNEHLIAVLDAHLPAVEPPTNLSTPGSRPVDNPILAGR